MTSWKVPMEDQEAILAHLISHNFLNEERFAEAYTSGKVNIKKWGKIKIKQHLSQKRISDYSIKKALENIDLEAYSRNISSLAEKKYYSLSKEPNSYKKKTKIYRYFASKGYETDLFKPVVDELFVSS
jgi:regulatory protein